MITLACPVSLEALELGELSLVDAALGAALLAALEAWLLERGWSFLSLFCGLCDEPDLDGR